MIAVADSLVNAMAGSHPDTEAYRVYEMLRRDIRSGRIEPGAPLRTNWLKETYQASTSPLREALARLNAEFYVTTEGKRGFRVTNLFFDEFVALTELRNDLEAKGLRVSIAARSENWESRVLLAHHALSKTRIDDMSDIETVEKRESHHRRFHLELLSECGSRWLLRVYDQVASHIERYRHIALRNTTFDDSYTDLVEREHRKLMEMAFQGQAEEAVSFLLAHRKRNFDQVSVMFEGLLEV